MNHSPVIFGEVLFDCFPDGSRVLGGAPFNVSWHLQAFGVTPLLISRVGDDPLGRQVKAAMQEWGMDASGLQLDSAHPTGIVEVTLSGGEPHYDIVRDRAWDFVDAAYLPPLPDGGVLYYGTLALRNKVSAAALGRIKQISSLPAFIDINLRPPWWTGSLVSQVISEGRWLKLNADELALIVPREGNTDDRIRHLFETLPLQYLIITEGSAGAIAVSAGGERYRITPGEKTEVVDTVGAGDAFSSVFLLGQLKGWPIQQTLDRAQVFASAIVGNRGATVSDKKFYQPFIDAWNLTG